MTTAAFDSNKAIAHLKQKWQGRMCPLCGAGNWTVVDKMFQLMEYTDGGLTLGAPVLPVIPVVCGNCGNTILVNALIAKLMPASAEKTDGQG